LRLFQGNPNIGQGLLINLRRASSRVSSLAADRHPAHPRNLAGGAERASNDSSRALKNAKYERYCRLRASALPRIQVYREVGWRSREDDVAYINACRLERRSEIRDRIAYLTRQEEVAEKRRRIEEQLWEIHAADIGDCFETYEAAKVGKDGDGKMLTVRKQRPRLLSDLPPDLRKAIEHVQVDARGNIVPQLYSKLQANAELRKMLNIGGQKDQPETDVSQGCPMRSSYSSWLIRRRSSGSRSI
jgi:hypothetical protein